VQRPPPEREISFIPLLVLFFLPWGLEFEVSVVLLDAFSA